jgi:hypothetical protein
MPNVLPNMPLDVAIANCRTMDFPFVEKEEASPRMPHWAQCCIAFETARHDCGHRQGGYSALFEILRASSIVAPWSRAAGLTCQ